MKFILAHNVLNRNFVWISLLTRCLKLDILEHSHPFVTHFVVKVFNFLRKGIEDYVKQLEAAKQISFSGSSKEVCGIN